MADDLDNVFPPVAEEPAPEVAPEPVVEPEVEMVEPEAPVEAEPQPEEVVEPARPEPGFVPISALMDERDKRKAAEALARQFEQRPQPQMPDPFDNPQEFAQYQTNLVQQAIVADRFERSNEDSIEKYGETAVQAAIEWAGERARTNPGFAAEYMSKTSPVKWIVQQHQRHGVLDQIGDRSIDDFVKDYVSKNPALLANAAPVAAAAPAVAQQASPVKVPRSLATQGSSPSDVRDVATGPLAAVDAVFAP